MKLDIQKFADGKVVIETELDTSGFENGIEDMENSSKLSQIIEAIKSKFSEIGSAISNVIKKAGSGLAGLGKKIIGIGSIALKTMGKILFSAVKFGVALIGALGVVALIGLAFLSVMEAINKVGEQNKTLKNDIQYIIFALKTALAPVIDAIAGVLVKIINFLVTIVKYAMALANVLAGRNLFEKATPEAFAKSMEKANKSAKGVAKSAKEIKKQLTGFDEMNVLSDNKSGGGGGAGGGPDYSTSFDASNLGPSQEQVQATVDRYKKFWDEILQIDTAESLALMVQQDTTWGLMNWGFLTFIKGIIEMIQGVVDIFGGVFKIIYGLFTGNIDKIFEGVKQLWKGIKELVLGFADFLTGIVGTVLGAIWGAWKWLWDKFESAFPGLASTVKGFMTTVLNLLINPFKVMWQFVKETINNVKTLFKGLFQIIKGLFTGDWKTMLEGFKNVFKSVVNQLWTIFKVPLNLIIGGVNAFIKGLNKIKFDVPDWIPLIGGKKFGFNLKEIPKLAQGGIINMPGRGTPIAIGGEAGREAVVPLTDSQQMELLGEAIGRYITINANITNNMNGRVISRELQKIQNENSFAGNR